VSKPVTQLTDDELFDDIREQVNLSRHTGQHDRPKTRALAAEADRRGWNLRRPKTCPRCRGAGRICVMGHGYQPCDASNCPHPPNHTP
jgi:hypothetical protein